MTSSAAWLAEAGLPPVNVDTVLVVRSHPIRVAGNSGPMPDEIDWPTLARRMNVLRFNDGLAPVAPEHAIVEFEQALSDVVHEEFPEVVAEIGEPFCTKFQFWNDAQRVRFRVCLSEANARALKRLPEYTVKQLAFFEKTTVTKKLRRVALLSLEEVKRAIAMNGPARIAYTFLNYDFPHLVNKTDNICVWGNDVVTEKIKYLERELGVRIDYVTTGPYPEHVIEI